MATTTSVLLFLNMGAHGTPISWLFKPAMHTLYSRDREQQNRPVSKHI